MMMNKVPLLTAEDIEVRVNREIKSPGRHGVQYLLYKNARVDMNILDNVYGSMNWQRMHELIDNKCYCTVSVWDDEKKQWISKQDVGTESNIEAEKGQASDAFKRACTNFGIGRELYTAPNITIWIDEKEKPPFLHVVAIKYNQRKISFLELANDENQTIFTWTKQKNSGNTSENEKRATATTPAEELRADEKMITLFLCEGCGELQTFEPVPESKIESIKKRYGGLLLCKDCRKAYNANKKKEG